jgi:hypothetical protein
VAQKGGACAPWVPVSDHHHVRPHVCVRPPVCVCMPTHAQSTWTLSMQQITCPLCPLGGLGFRPMAGPPARTQVASATRGHHPSVHCPFYARRGLKFPRITLKPEDGKPPLISGRYFLPVFNEWLFPLCLWPPDTPKRYKNSIDTPRRKNPAKSSWF